MTYFENLSRSALMLGVILGLGGTGSIGLGGSGSTDKTVESIGSCFASKLSADAISGYATGRANVYIAGRDRLVLSLAYNQIMEEVPMPYQLELKGGFEDPGARVDAVDFYFEMARLSDEEVRSVIKRAIDAGDKEVLDLAFPNGVPAVWEGAAFDKGLADLMVFYYGEIDRFMRPLGKLIGAMAYRLDGSLSDREETLRFNAFTRRADQNAARGEFPSLKFEVMRKDGRGRAFNLSDCL